MRSRRRGLLTLAIVAVAIVAAWLPAMGAPWVYDDKIEVVGNRSIRLLEELGAIATYNTSRPLLIATYALNWRLGGFDPLGYHVVSVAIHVLNVLLVARLCRHFTDPTRALLAATLWGLHPMCIEAVTYISGRSDALCATGWLLAMIAWAEDRRALAWIATGAALLTKETALAIPIALWGVDRALGRPTALRAMAPAAGLIGAASALRLAMYGWPAGEVPRDAWVQAATETEGWTRYLGLWLLPIGQSILHDLPAAVTPARVGMGVGWVAAMVLGVRAGGLAALATAIWGGTLVLASILPMKEFIPEHRAYLAGLAVVLPFAAWVRWSRAAFALAGVLFAATVSRNLLWTSEVAIWEEAARWNPASADAAYGHGDALRFAGDFPGAEAAYRACLALDPDRLDAKVNLGITRAEQGDLAGAKVLWLETLRADPKHCAAHNDLAGLDLRAHRLQEAISGYATTLAWCPQDPIAHLNLGNLFFDLGRAHEAARHFHTYLDVAPEGPGAVAARETLRRIE